MSLYLRKMLQHRPAGLSDSEDEFEFGSDSVYMSNDNYQKNGSRSGEHDGSVEYSSNITASKVVGSVNGENFDNASGLVEATAEKEHLIQNVYHSPISYKKQRLKTELIDKLEDLRMAIVSGNLPVMKKLLDKGVAIDQYLKNGWTPLICASFFGKADIVLYLLEKGANPNLHKEMFTAIMAACASSHNSEADLKACVGHLLGYGAKADACDKYRITPLMFACREGRVSLIESLVPSDDVLKRKSIDRQDNTGRTPLCWAAQNGRGLAVRKLLQLGADPRILNRNGQRPADIALAAGCNEIADILERAGNGSNLDDTDETKLDSPLIIKEIVEGPVCGELEMVLCGLDLSHLIPLFRKHKIILSCFVCLKEVDFISMGIEELGTRKKLLKSIVDIAKQDWQTSSLPNLTQLTYITLPDAVAMVQNINRHIRFIHATIGHLRDEVQTTPGILELGQGKFTVATLSDAFSDTIKNLSPLEKEVKVFVSYLEKVRHNVEFLPADIILVKKRSHYWKPYLLFSLGTVTSFSIFLYWYRPNILDALFRVRPKLRHF